MRCEHFHCHACPDPNRDALHEAYRKTVIALEKSKSDPSAVTRVLCELEEHIRTALNATRE